MPKKNSFLNYNSLEKKHKTKKVSHSIVIRLKFYGDK
jgi:hypothetical protein